MPTEQCNQVPLASELKGGRESWCGARDAWQSAGVTCADSLRCIRNFIGVTRPRASGGHEQEDGNSDDMVSDEELTVSTGEQLEEALHTHVDGRKPKDANDVDA